MKPRAQACFAVALLALAAQADLPAWAQPRTESEGLIRPRRYHELPIDGDPLDLFKAQLKAGKDFEPMRELLQSLLKDPQNLKLDPDAVKHLDLASPELQKLLEAWRKEAKALPSAEDLEQVKANLKKALEGSKGMPPKILQDLPKVLDGTLPLDPPLEKPAPSAGAPKPDLLTRAMQRWMQKIDPERLPAWLRDSKAMRELIDGSAEAMAEPAAASALNLPDFDLPDHLPEWLVLDRLQGLEGALQNLRLGELAGRPPLPGGMGLPQAGPLTLPSLGSAHTGSLTLVALLMLGAAGVAVQLYHARKQAQQSGRARVEQPLDVDAVATRAQLVQAFDQLALRTLGPGARSRHHRDIARQWAADAGSADAARTLADLYEMARYVPGPAALTPEQLAAARRSLVQLLQGGLP